MQEQNGKKGAGVLGQRSGAHTDTRLCSDRFNVFVLQKKKKLFVFIFSPHPPTHPRLHRAS